MKAVKRQKTVDQSRKVQSFFPPALLDGNRALAERRLVYAAILNGWSYNSLQRPELKAFFKVLRPDFEAPSMYKIGKIRDQLLADVMAAVDQKIAQGKLVTLAFDGWVNHHHTQTLAVAAITQGQTLLMLLKEVERETAEAYLLFPCLSPSPFFSPAGLAN